MQVRELVGQSEEAEEAGVTQELEEQRLEEAVPVNVVLQGSATVALQTLAVEEALLVELPEQVLRVALALSL